MRSRLYFKVELLDYSGASYQQDGFSNLAERESPQSSCRKTIVVLASSPTNEARLRLEKEVREIDEGLRRSHHKG